MTPRFGGLPHGDVDTWWLRLSQAGGVVPSAVLRVFVPNATGPPPFIYNHATPVPIAASTATETRYDISLRGCDWFVVSLSATRGAPGSSPLRRPDVLYRLEMTGHSSATPVTPDSSESGGGNDTADRAFTLSAGGWTDYTGPASVVCSTGSKTRTISNLSLHGCEDVDWYRIVPWAGYDPASASWGALKAELVPPIPGVRLQFFEEVDHGGATVVEATRAIGDGGGAGVFINTNAHPLPLLLKLDGDTTERFALKLTFCVPSQSFIDSAAGGASARSGRNGAMEFWEALRELRFLEFSIPRDFGPDLTGQMVEFGWNRDKAGRSMQGQLFLMHHNGGDLRAGAIPGNPDASLRLDLTDLKGGALGGIATEDLQDTDGNDPNVSFCPLSAPFVLESKGLPVGDYLLAVSGFKLTDTWTLVPGAANSMPGFATAENLMGLPPQQGQLPSALLPVPARGISGLNALTGGPFDLHPLNASKLSFTAPQGAAWRLEYASAGTDWSESGPATKFPGSTFAYPPPGGSYRIRSIWPRRVLSVSASAATYFAVPTEIGRSYAGQFSDDLNFWLTGSAPRAGDGSVFLYSVPMFNQRNFMRVRRY
jgi:hypothetical protein